MNPGDVLILVATVTALGAAVARAFSMRSRNKDLINLSVLLSLGTFLALTSAFLLLTYYFLSSEMSIYYVWNYSSTDLDTIYKLSGVWAGAQGSFLLWTWFMSIVLLVEVILEPRRKYLRGEFHHLFQIALSGLLFIFMLILMTVDLFSATPGGALSIYPNGRGMELVLQTPEMVIHPPVVFAGYAFAVAALAASLAYFVSKDENWFMVSLPWSRLSWIFLTLGIGIGAIWAYYVLGWGGYWGWDPVETSSLLPWLIVTLFLHTQLRHARNGEYPIASPALGIISFVAVLFATFATRAGSIWGSSVHAFLSGDRDAGLLGILRDDSTVLGIFTLMVSLLAVSMYLVYWKYQKSEHPAEESEPPKLSGYISDKNNMLFTVLLISMTTLIILLLLFKNAGSSASANFDEFNQKMSFFFVAIMIVMTVCLIWRFLGQDLALWLGVLVVAASIVFGVAAMASSFSPLVAFSLPSYLVAIGASAYKLSKSRVPGSLRKTMQNLSPHLIHLGVALVLLGYVVSSNMQTYADDSEDKQGITGNTVLVGDSLAVGNYNITLVSLTQRAEGGTPGSPDMILTLATLNISRSGDRVQSGVVLTDKYTWGTTGYQVAEVDVHIFKSVQNDLYINFQWLNSTTAFIQAKTVPLMNVLWGGFGLLVIGLAIRTVAWKIEPKRQVLTKQGGPSKAAKKPTPAPKGPPKEGEAEKDYEAIVEEELKKFKEKRSR